MRNIFLAVCVLSALSVLAERQPFERYQTIVDRQMFGSPPAGFDPTKMPSEVAKTKSKADQELTQEQEKVKKAIKFSVLNVTPDGETVVGFSDNGDPKNPLHYYLKVGESQNGWTVKEADKDEATMTIEKDGIEVTLKLGGDSASDANAVARTGAANTATAGASGGSSLLGGMRSLRERRRQREEQIRAEESAKRAEEDKARAAREEAASQQREAEREEQRKQLQQIQEELRKAREAREAEKAETEKNKTTEAETTTNEAQ